MKYVKIGAAFFIIAVIVSLFFILNRKEQQICFGKDCYTIEIADEPHEREVGLMYRENLDRNKGMLFIFENYGNYPFWMKNTIIPLDMIWMDEEGKVVYIKEQAMPCESDPCEIINPNANAKQVLEVNAGVVAESNITLGQQAVLVNVDE